LASAQASADASYLCLLKHDKVAIVGDPSWCGKHVKTAVALSSPDDVSALERLVQRPFCKSRRVSV